MRQTVQCQKMVQYERKDTDTATIYVIVTSAKHKKKRRQFFLTPFFSDISCNYAIFEVLRFCGFAEKLLFVVTILPFPDTQT